MIMSDAFEMDLFLVEFVSECREATELAVQDVLNLEQVRDQDSVDRIFRALHSIKGNASMFGLMALSEFVHKVEDTCSDIRSGERSIDKQAINVLLRSFDFIEDAFDNIIEKGSDEIDYSKGYALLKELAGEAGGFESESELPEDPVPHEKSDLQEVSKVPEDSDVPEDLDIPEVPYVSEVQDVTGVQVIPEETEQQAYSGSEQVSPELSPEIVDALSGEVLNGLHDDAYIQSDGAETLARLEEEFRKSVEGQKDRLTSEKAFSECDCSSAYPARENPTALIVDDDFATRKIFVSFLSKYMPCYVAKDGVEAIQAVTESFAGKTPHFDLIIMDIMMPNIDGLQACKAIRQIEQSKNMDSFSKESKIFIASTLSDDKTMLKAVYECGADTYLIKPVEFPDLRRQLVRYRLVAPE